MNNSNKDKNGCWTIYSRYNSNEEVIFTGKNLQKANLQKANLQKANLRGVDLSEADLRGADLRGADLEKANLRGADLRGADLRGADLSETNLRGSDLEKADLEKADLEKADLSEADLRGADLRFADLRHVDLRHVDLSHVDLLGAKFDQSYIDSKQICPAGGFYAWKKTTKGVIRVYIPKSARRVNALNSRKCRCDRLKATSGAGCGGVGKSCGGVVYNKGEYVVPDSYNDDPTVEFTNGLHFFLTKQEAKQWP